MRVAALYDVHGNLPALEAVLAEVEQEAADVILVGGDVSAGPFPAECLELLQGLGERAVWIRGNADRSLAEGGADQGLADQWCAGQLTDDQRAFLGALPVSTVLDVDELGPVLFCHGSPRSDEEILTERSPEVRIEVALAGVGQQTVVHGHTHVAYDRGFGLYRLICPGSVGMAYAPVPGAYWGLFGPGFEQRHTEYDLDAAAERIRASGWPKADRFAAENVVSVPDPDEVVEFFEKVAAAEER
jgi:predicted phosphodiesterase